MMLNSGVLPLTHIDGTPINGVSGEFYGVDSRTLTTGKGLNLTNSELLSRRGVVVLRATCTQAHYYDMRPPFLVDMGKQLQLTNAMVVLNNSLTVVPWGLPRNVGDSFKSYFVFDSLPGKLEFLIKMTAKLGTLFDYSDITATVPWYQIEMKIYY